MSPNKIMNPINLIQNHFRDLLEHDEYFVAHNVKALAENQKDIGYIIDEAMSATGIAATVITPRLQLIGKNSDGKPMAEISELIIQITESPILNRDRANHATAWDTAIRTIEIIDSDICQWQRAEELQANGENETLLIVNVIFATTIQVIAQTEE